MYGVGQDGNVTTVLLTLSHPTMPAQPAAGTTTNNNNSELSGASASHKLYVLLSCPLGMHISIEVFLPDITVCRCMLQHKGSCCTMGGDGPPRKHARTCTVIVYLP